MTGSTSLPAIVLVHGAWHTPYHYATLLTRFADADFSTHCPQLPSSSGWAGATLADDVAVVRRTIEPLIAAGQQLVLIAHSYGGMVTSNASRGFSVRERQAQGLDGGIAHIVYLCSFMATAGESLQSITQSSGQDQSTMRVLEDGQVEWLNPIPALYAELDQKRAEELASKLNPFCFAAALGVCEWQPWAVCPVTFLVCARDKIFSPDLQRKLVANARNKGGKISEVTLDAEHSPFESMPDKVKEAVHHAWEESNKLESAAVF